MLLAIRHLPLVRQTLIGVIIICTLAALGLSLTLSFHTRTVALEESRNTLQTQTALIVRTLEYAEERMKQEAMQALTQFASELPPAHLTGNRILIGGEKRPELMFGNNIPATNNQAFIQAYKKRNPLNDVAFLVRDGDKLYRATTLLKDANNQYRDGEVVSDDYALTLLQGETHIGTVQRSGKIYALAIQPVKDSQGQVIGAINMRIDVGDNIRILKEKLGSITIGQSGFPFIIAEASGDNKEPFLVMHPTLQGKTLNQLDTDLQHSLAQILEKRNGEISYPWAWDNKTIRQNLAVFNEISALQWIIVASAPEEEFTAPFESIRNLLLVGLAGMTVLLAGCLWLLVRWQLRPLKYVAQGLEQMGQGDLTYDIDVEAGSRNEISQLALRVNATRDAMKNLVGTIRTTADSVSGSASDASESMHQLSSGMDSLSSSSSEISDSIERLSLSVNNIAQSSNAANERVNNAVSKVKHGKRVVLDVIDSMRDIEYRANSSLSEVEGLVTHSRKIETVVASIGQIASQTNLLALNAAIEAARAGEVGRGFAVVADEVRKLAEQSAQSASEIGLILGQVTSGVTVVQAAISEVVGETRKGAESSTVAGAALEEIESMTHDVASAIAIITEATHEQATAAQLMTELVATSVQAVEENNNVTRNVSQNAAHLKEKADALTRDVGYFTI